MLNIVFGRENSYGEYVVHTDIHYKRNKKLVWFENDFVRKFLREIDCCEVLFDEALLDKNSHGISTAVISQACKLLCCIYFDTRGTYYNGYFFSLKTVESSLTEINISL